VAYGLVSVSFHWNNFLWPLVVTSSVTTRPVTVGLQVFSSVDQGIDWTVISAAALMTSALPAPGATPILRLESIIGDARGRGLDNVHVTVSETGHLYLLMRSGRIAVFGPEGAYQQSLNSPVGTSWNGYLTEQGGRLFLGDYRSDFPWVFDDRRQGEAPGRFLQAGIGYGGSCFPKDVKALISTLKQKDCDSDLFEAVNRINEKQKSVVVEKLKSILEIKDSTIAVWGISFKPKTDDIREAPSIKIIEELQNMGAKIHACDPVAIENAKNVLTHVKFFENPYETIRDCDALIVATEWNEFRNLDMRAVKILLKHPIIVDGRNIYDPKEIRSLGFKYMGIGR